MEDLFFAVKIASQKLSKYYSKVTSMMGMLFISAHILDPFRKLPLFRKGDKGMDINSEDQTSYSTQYQEAMLKYVENEYCAKHQHVMFNQLESLPRSISDLNSTASKSCQTSFDPYNLNHYNEEYLTPNMGLR
jgi:hypothetical protein